MFSWSSKCPSSSVDVNWNGYCLSFGLIDKVNCSRLLFHVVCWLGMYPYNSCFMYGLALVRRSLVCEVTTETSSPHLSVCLDKGWVVFPYDVVEMGGTTCFCSN